VKDHADAVMIAGYLRPGAEKQLIDFHNEFNEQLSQPPIVAAGRLRDRDGQRQGYLGFIGGRLHRRRGPLPQAGSVRPRRPVRRVEVYRYDVEVGAVGA